MKRDLNDKSKKIIYWYSFIFVIIHIVNLLINVMEYRQKTVLFVGFIVSLIFLIYKPSKKSDDKIKFYDIIFSILAIIVTVYYVCFFEEILNRSLMPTVLEMIFAIIIILLILETCRRTVGNVLPIIAIIALLYAFLGDKLGGIWNHRHYSLSRIVNILYMTDNGIYGSVSKIACVTVFSFSIIGVFFKKTYIGNFLTNLVKSLIGKFYGGVGLVSVISSGLFGMISGSAASNVVTTGQFTIPMMKKEGFSPEFSAAVEATASAGGTLTPPILGAAIFIMIDIIGVPYNTIVKCTILPALIYYISIAFMVYFTAKKEDIKGKEKTENWIDILKKKWFFLLPIVLLIVLILKGYPLLYVSLISSAVMIIIQKLSNQENDHKKKILLDGLSDVGISCLATSIACICSEIIIGVLNLTGIGVRISEIIINLSGINIILALIATMIMVIILGMGLPAVVSYIIAASIAAPVLISMGIDKVPAHLFIFYFSCLSSITPPVALNAYLASGIAESNPIKTAITSCKICLPIFAIPYMIIFQPAIMLESTLIKCLITAITAFLGTLFLALGIVGFSSRKLKNIERIIYIFVGICFLDSKYITDIIAILLLVSVKMMIKIDKKIFNVFKKCY